MPNEQVNSTQDPFDMRGSAAEPSVNEEAQRQRALWCEKYYLVFANPTGQEVLDHMKKRAFFEHSTLLGNPPQHVRDMREGMRMFVLETQGFVTRHAKGTEKQPMQSVALSNTTEAERET